MIESQFEELQALVEKAKREVTEILEGEQKQALKQAEGIRVHLEQRCTELKKTQGRIEKLSRNKNDVDFLQVTLPESSLRYDAVVHFCRAKSCLKAAAILMILSLNVTLFCRSTQSGKKKPLIFLCLGSTSA